MSTTPAAPAAPIPAAPAAIVSAPPIPAAPEGAPLHTPTPETGESVVTSLPANPGAPAGAVLPVSPVITTEGAITAAPLAPPAPEHAKPRRAGNPAIKTVLSGPVHQAPELPESELNADGHAPGADLTFEQVAAVNRRVEEKLQKNRHAAALKKEREEREKAGE